MYSTLQSSSQEYVESISQKNQRVWRTSKKMFLVAVIYMHAIAQAVPLTWRATIMADFGVVVTANGQTMVARKKVQHRATKVEVPYYY